MSDLTITEFDPQSTDSERMLLARLLAFKTRERTRATALASAARTVSTQTADIETAGFTGLAVWLNCTVAGASGGITLYLLTQDPVSGNWATNYAILPIVSSVRISSALLGPGVSIGSNVNLVSGNSDRGIVLPSKIRFYAVASDASSYTYSLGYELIP